MKDLMRQMAVDSRFAPTLALDPATSPLGNTSPEGPPYSLNILEDGLPEGPPRGTPIHQSIA